MENLRIWLLATRPWSFTMSAISVTVGAALAAGKGPFHWGLYLTSIVAMILIHGGGNLINDYFDVRRGVDTAEVATATYRPHPLAQGILKPPHIISVSLLLFALGLALGLWLCLLRGWWLLPIGLAGIFGGLAYTAPPFGYKYKALGEFAVFALWGPLAVEGAYYVQRQSLSWSALLVSLPFGVLVALVLLANNIRDVEHDRRAGIMTIPIALGKEVGLQLYLVLIALAYGAVAMMSLLGPLSYWSLLVLLSLPLAAKLMRTMKAAPPSDADARTAQLNTAFGLLLVLSLVLQRIV